MKPNSSVGGPKSVGAYYTPVLVAEALSRWAIRRPDDTVLDPAAGDGILLVAAGQRLLAMGGEAGSVRGFELRPQAAAEARERLAALGLDAVQVITQDFLKARPARPPTVAAVIGNPPFVRFQRLVGARRATAQASAARAGVTLDPLAASWAAFVIHSCQFLRPGGRLALVLPNEVGHARYARTVLAFLRDRFQRVTFVTPTGPMFPHLDQGALLLLAEGHGCTFEDFRVARVPSVEVLDASGTGSAVRSIDAEALIGGQSYLHRACLTPQVEGLLTRLAASGGVTRLNDHARVSTGYVTGANGYFHLSPEDAKRRGLDAKHLRPTLFRTRALRGIVVRPDDWVHGTHAGHSGYLLQPGADHDPALTAYLREGVERGVTEGTKVRARTPWYQVGRVSAPDLVLTAMAGHAPRLAVNEACLPVSNTLHGVWLHDASRDHAGALALASLTSLAQLSAELEGHGMGGGLLKLEPSEAQRLLLPLGPTDQAERRPTLADAIDEADRYLRAGRTAEARALADRVLLEPLLENEPDALEAFRAATAGLRRRRKGA